jgi:hypothetical protein
VINSPEQQTVNQGQIDQPSGFISVQELRRVLTRIMQQSRGELQRLKDLMEQYKDDDPACIAQLYIKVTEHSSEWNTALLVAGALSVKLDDHLTHEGEAQS